MGKKEDVAMMSDEEKLAARKILVGRLETTDVGGYQGLWDMKDHKQIVKGKQISDAGTLTVEEIYPQNQTAVDVAGVLVYLAGVHVLGKWLDCLDEETMRVT